MAILYIHHRVDHLEAWLQAFADRSLARKEAGVTAVRVLQAEGDPQFIVELVFFDTADSAHKYHRFLREQVWSSSSSELASDPASIVLTDVETPPIRDRPTWQN
jgi:hypothetical protein